jgi:four helix bundle protein
MKDFRELKVWEKSHRLALKVYSATAKFPREELYGLTSQIRRASVSIPTNIAEGCGRNRDSELYRFFEIAMGSASELEYLFLLTRDLGVIDKADFEGFLAEIIEIKRMLASFIQKLKADVAR